LTPTSPCTGAVVNGSIGEGGGLDRDGEFQVEASITLKIFSLP
jgi:hypothetical protein